MVKDTTTGTILRDLTEEGEVCVLVEGGEGGVGNAAFATADCRRTRDCTVGSAGVESEVELELKTIADVGMVSIKLTLVFCGVQYGTVEVIFVSGFFILSTR